MFLSLDLANLLLYCAQQLGVALGLGAQTILLVAYLQSMRDGVIDVEEAQFAHAVRVVRNVGLGLIIISGVAIGAIELLQGSDVLLQPAYLFKWALLIFILLLNVFGGAVPQNLLEGLRGGTWYALFVVHILAPVTSWVNLFTLYAVWMVGFSLVWMALLPLTHERTKKAVDAKKVEPKQEPKPEPNPVIKIELPKIISTPASVVLPPPPPKPPTPPKAPLPVVQPLEIGKPALFVPPSKAPPELHPPTKPKPQPMQQASATLVAPIESLPQAPDNPWLPKIKIMPKSPEQIK